MQGVGIMLTEILQAFWHRAPQKDRAFGKNHIKVLTSIVYIVYVSVLFIFDVCFIILQ